MIDTVMLVSDEIDFLKTLLSAEWINKNDIQHRLAHLFLLLESLDTTLNKRQ